MKVSYRWLQEYVEGKQPSVAELADSLTMAGLEVEGYEERYFSFPETVVVGEILEVEQHEASAHAFICQVDVGRDEAVTIVCGAPNTTSGLKSPVALPGTVLPNGMEITRSTIRGTISEGMFCAEDELGISEDHSGIIELPPELPVGVPLTPDMLVLEHDTVLEIGLTPNRGDCLSHLGVAREVATLFHGSLRKPSVEYAERGPAISDLATVTIEAPDLCPRYVATVITDVTIAPSPLWLKRRVESIGMRSINNVVDVTNFVMHELGQPLHAFDLDTLEDRQIVVRRAAEGEQFTTLDEVDRQLDANMLMICDGQRSVAIAGVMGGLNSEITDTTTNILLESAYFLPSSIRKTSKQLGLSTEASYRFERGIDISGTEYAARRATQLIAELGNGTVAEGIIDGYPHPFTPISLSLRLQRTEDILGVAIAPETIQEIFEKLEFRVLSATADHIDVEVPSFRPDVTREIDLIEEVGRIYGYENIQPTLPSGEIPAKIDNTPQQLRTLVRDLLVGQGLYEVINYSFLDEQHLAQLGVAEQSPYKDIVTLKNPLTVEQAALRTTTIPGLIKNVLLNRSNRIESLRFFEIGNIFIDQHVPEVKLPQELTAISGALAGSKQTPGWTHQQQAVDFYDLKGIIENLLEALHVPGEFRHSDSHPFLHPGESAEVYVGEESMGFLGRLHPDTIEAFALDVDAVYVLELILERLAAHSDLQQTFRPLPKFPAVHRDLALVVPADDVVAAQVEALIRHAGQPLLEQVRLFDRYVGPQITDGSVGLTYSLSYRSLEKTLVDEEVTAIHQRIIDQLQSQLGVTLR